VAEGSRAKARGKAEQGRGRQRRAEKGRDRQREGSGKAHGKPVSYGVVGHVEPKLMLHWALLLLKELTDKVPSIGRL
jgi:hypothetical protein